VKRIEEAFKPQLLETDLPPGETVSLRAATCWLAGLPQGSLDDPATSDPKSKVRLGRSERSAHLWDIVLRHVVALESDPDAAFPWEQLIDHDVFAKAPPEPLRSRAETRFTQAALAHCKKRDRTAADLQQDLHARVSHEVSRKWAIRSSLHDLARHLPELLHKAESGKRVLQLLGAGSKFTGFCLSLRTNSLDGVKRPGYEGVNSVEVWRATKSGIHRSQLLHEPNFDRTALMETFVFTPDRERDAWISEIQEAPHWPIDLAISYLKHAGDLGALWNEILTYRGSGHVVATYAKIAKDAGDPVDEFFGGLRLPEVDRIELWLRQGKVHASGIRPGSDRMEPIWAVEWNLLRIGWDSFDGPSHATAQPDEAIRWNRIYIERSELQQIVSPQSFPTDMHRVHGKREELVPVDADWKEEVWRLAGLLKSLPNNTKLEELAEQFGSDHKSDRWAKRYFAAKVLVPQAVVDRWEKSGPRPKRNFA
jgi:hypothetical protein